MLLDEVGARIIAAGYASSTGLGGWVLMKSRLPDSTALPDKLVAIIETAGLPSEARTEVDKPGFQLLVRGTSLQRGSSGYSEARSQAQSIKNDLHARGPGALGTTAGSTQYYVGIWAQQDPFLLEYDAQNRPVIACNFLAQRSRT